jgi:hypothetical protein
MNKLIVGRHLLTSLEVFKVPLTGTEIIAVSFKTMGESLGISFTSITSGSSSLELLILLLRRSLLLLLLGFR